jgi:hypothetical protein
MRVYSERKGAAKPSRSPPALWKRMRLISTCSSRNVCRPLKRKGAKRPQRRFGFYPLCPAVLICSFAASRRRWGVWVGFWRVCLALDCKKNCYRRGYWVAVAEVERRGTVHVASSLSWHGMPLCGEEVEISMRRRFSSMHYRRTRHSASWLHGAMARGRASFGGTCVGVLRNEAIATSMAWPCRSLDDPVRSSFSE